MSDWKEITLGEIATITMGQSPKGEDCNTDGHGLPLLNGPTEFGHRHPYPIQFTTDPKKKAVCGDLLFCVRGSTTGRMNWADQEYAIGRGIASIRSKCETHIQLYIKAVIDQHLKELLAVATGSTFPNVSRDDLSNLRLLSPPSDVRDFISELANTIDRKIENLRKQNETLEAIAQTLFKHWFVDFEFLNEDGKPYKSSGGEMVRSELGEIPAGWNVGKLGDFGKVITGKTPSTQNPNYWDSGLPFVTPTDFKNYGKFVLNSEREISNLAMSEFKSLIIPDKSVVVTCIGSDMGKVARTATQCITNQQLNSLVFDRIRNGMEYAYQFLVSQYKMLRLMALGGSTMPIINKTAFSNIEIVIPDFLTLDKFNEIVEPFNLKVINNEQQIQTLTKQQFQIQNF